MLSETGEKSTVACIFQDTSGKIQFEKVGTCCPEEPATVLWQQGLKHNPQDLPRSTCKILSRWKIKSGGSDANVPWANVGFSQRLQAGDALRRPACTACSGAGCVACLGETAAGHVKAVLFKDAVGSRECGWFVAFEGEHGCLTRLPAAVVERICERLSGGKPLRPCECGGCHHPLLTLQPTTTNAGDAARFDETAVGLFTSYRRGVRTAASQREAAAAAPAFAAGVTTELGECAICFEECEVARNACVGQRCSIAVCKDCHAKTMGLCPICDRAKLNDDVDFYCQCCGEVSPLDWFAYACSGCGSPTSCGDCYLRFGKCNACTKKVHEAIGAKKRKPPREASGCGKCARADQHSQ